MNPNDFTNAGGTSSRHNHNTEREMEAKTNPNEVRAIWTKPDGEEVEGLASELMEAYAAAGFAGKLRRVEPPQEEPQEEPPAIEKPKPWPATPAPLLSLDDGHYTPGGRGSPSTAPVVESIEVVRDRREAAADRTDWATEVHELDKASADRDTQMLKDMGLTPGRTLFAPGTPLVKWGLDKWRTERQAVADWPTMREAADAVRSQVIAERRVDDTVPAHRLRMKVDDGRLVVHRGGGGLFLERHGLEQLASRCAGFLPPTNYVRSMNADEVAHLWNSRAERGLLKDMGDIVLRHRRSVDDVGRSIYAAVSKSYGVHDVHQVASDLARILGPDTPASLVYDPDRVSLAWEAMQMRDVPPVVGEVWKAGLKGGSRDDGKGSAWTLGALLRALCVNLTTEELETSRSRQRHRGHSVGLNHRIQLKRAWAAVQPAMEAFSSRWTILAQTDATEVLGGSDVREAIARLVDSDKSLRDAAAVKRDALVQMLLAGLDADETADESVATVVNAVTRLHESKLPVHRVSAVQARAGELAKHWAQEVANG